ncbi:MAG: CpsB/CapC family capsule biosynthesis tyrosine phosphatase [Longimicrobiales bacterium]|nr:CpsB/CapC family capsule biosynthesis tyrosine phosphatase [Longimicrobiales bacterium]
MSEDARVDIHSHLVPGVDDGARTLDDALESIGRMTRLGIRSILTTPHLDASLLRLSAGPERVAAVEAAFEGLADAVAREYPAVHLARGFEIMLDDPDPDLSDPALRMAGTTFALVEWPSMQVPPETSEVIRRLCGAGVRPIIAHPERYHTGEPIVTLAGIWRAAGATLQVNLGSLMGRYGARAEERAWALLAGGSVDYLASDHHGRPHLELHHEQVARAFEDRGAEEEFKMLVRTNPQRILDDRAPLPVRPVQRPRGWRSRLRNLFRTSPS